MLGAILDSVIGPLAAYTEELYAIGAEFVEDEEQLQVQFVLLPEMEIQEALE